MTPDTERDKLAKELGELDAFQLLGIVWQCVGAISGLKNEQYAYRLVRGMMPEIRKEPEL
ncbi:MAG: hypothetical protein V3S51_07245 [Dehalococcoidia bacterium]